MKRHVLLLAAAVTDKTFDRTKLDGETVWVGKCVHCNTRLVVGDDGRARGSATLEHIKPQAQGGTDALANLAIACAPCNRQKGARHDHNPGPKLDQVVALLAARRAERWRDPADVGMAHRLASVLPIPP